VAQFGGAPWLIGGDWNVEAEDVAQIAMDRRIFFHLPRAKSFGTSRDISGRFARRIDFVVASDCLKGALSPEKQMWDILVPQHAAVASRLSCDGSRKVFSVWVLKSFSGVVNKKKIEEVAERNVNQIRIEWEFACKNRDLEVLWEMWNDLAEEVIKLGTSGGFQKGRGKFRKNVWSLRKPDGCDRRWGDCKKETEDVSGSELCR